MKIRDKTQFEHYASVIFNYIKVHPDWNDKYNFIKNREDFEKKKGKIIQTLIWTSYIRLAGNFKQKWIFITSHVYMCYDLKDSRHSLIED